MIPFSPLAALAGIPAVPVEPAPPTNVRLFKYGGDLIGVQWVNAQEVSTDIGYSATTEDPSSVFDSVGARVTSYNTDSETEDYWFVRHNAGKAEASAWVIAEPLG